MPNEAMMREFIETEGRRPEKPKARRRKGLPHESEKQQVKNETWQLIRASMLISQLRTQGFYSCFLCGVICEEPRMLDLDHIVPRSKGGDYGPRNAQLSCNRLSPNGAQACHVQRHGEPEWSTA